MEKVTISRREYDALLACVHGLNDATQFIEAYKSEIKHVIAAADNRTKLTSSLKTWKCMVTKHSSIVNAEMHKASRRSACDSVKLHIVESVHGTYAYHLSLTGKSYEQTLCSKRTVMASTSPLDTWNMEPTHLPYKFCAHCHRVAIAMGYNLPEPTANTRRF